MAHARSTERHRARTVLAAAMSSFSLLAVATAQETDLTQAPNPAGAGMAKSFVEQIGAGQGDLLTPDSSMFVIHRDPFRAIARGRALFQRKFTAAQGLGPRRQDGVGNIAQDGAIGAGLADSCAACHGRPRGAAGFGGDVFTRPESRDAPHLFGLGLVEMLADEITQDLRAIRSQATQLAAAQNRTVWLPLRSKGIEYGRIGVAPNGTVDTSRVDGVDADLRVRPFFAQGGTISIREFVVGALRAEMGLEAVDPLLLAASSGSDVVTPAGMHLTGSQDRIEAPAAQSAVHDPDGDGHVNEFPTSVVDHLEFYLLNYFRPATYRQGFLEHRGRQVMDQIGCTSCHVPDLVIEHDRRVADVQTVYDPQQGGMNSLFATAQPLFVQVPDNSGHPPCKLPAGGRFVVRGIYADFKRHDLGPAFHERNFDGTVQQLFMTEPLWGVGSTAPYGHDGRSVNLREVILRHGGEAHRSKRAFERLNPLDEQAVLAFLESLVLFGPPDTASNLDPAAPNTPGFPLTGHGSIKLSVLFHAPGIPE